MIHLFKTIRLRLILSIINFFLCGTHFFAIKRILLRCTGAQIAPDVKVVAPIRFNPLTVLSVGQGTWIGSRFTVEGNENVTIGACCDIAPELMLVTGTHEISPSPERRAGKGYGQPIKIEDGCWIGARVTILCGVIVGSGSILAAGTLVTKSCESNGLYGGIPAKEIRRLNA